MPVAQLFNEASNSENYVFDYRKEVEAFYAMFPQHNAVDFYDGSKMEYISRSGHAQKYVSAEIEKRITQAEAKYSTNPGYAEKLNGYNYIVLFSQKGENGLNMVPSLPIDQEWAFLLDHEIGHIVCQDGRDVFNLSEAVADCYAVIRHYQRFGIESEQIESLVCLRAYALFNQLDKGEHFSAPAVQKLIQDAERIDFESLSIDDTITLARRYARNYAMHPHTLSMFSEEITLPDKQAIKKNDYAAVREFFNQLSSTLMPEHLYWGTAAFRYMVENHSSDNTFPLPGDEWKEMLAVLDKKNDEIREFGGLFFGIDKKHIMQRGNSASLKKKP